MRGLRIIPETGTMGRPGSSIPYYFTELVEPIADRIAKLHWAATGSVVFSAQGRDDFPDDETFEGLFVESVTADDDSPIWERAWLKPGCLAPLAPFIDGDWTDIVGIQKPEDLSRADVDVNDDRWLEANARVYFTCVDGAFWAVFSTETQILSSLRDRFPQSEDMVLDDRWW